MFRVVPSVQDEPTLGATLPAEGGPSGGGESGGTTTDPSIAEAAGTGQGEPEGHGTITATDLGNDPHTTSEPASEPLVDDLPALDPPLSVPEPTTTTFTDARRYHEREETAILRPQPYGPERTRPTPASPYSRPPDATDDATNHVFEVFFTAADQAALPTGWYISNDGMITLQDEPEDEWILRDGWLVRRHYVPRDTLFDPSSGEADCPVPLHHLSKDRCTKMSGNQGRVLHDRWRNRGASPSTTWTGATYFKLTQNYRGLAREYFYHASDGHHSYTGATVKRSKDKNNLSEKTMSQADRLAFLEGKKKELESFFTNDVWVYDHEQNAPKERVLKAHFILKWSKNEDGSPRAKARLITQGFRDPDALQGKIKTDAPTLTKVSRNMILAISATLGWAMFSADISTAFLQGREHSKERTLWIRLPQDALSILGIKDRGTLMRLKKPMYGLVDAPRSWYLEARDRVLNLGARQHPLDSCLFLVYGPGCNQMLSSAEPTQKLLGIFGIHVDDVLGCADLDSSDWQSFKKKLREAFSFREWHESPHTHSFDYCGVNIHCHDPHHLELSQSGYYTKVKPIHFESSEEERTVSEKERHQLRALVGALQWPATQSAPHLQAMISNLAGSITRATTSTLAECNKALRFAKHHSDVKLEYQFLGPINELTFLVYCDAAFASRADLSSQGGYLLLMVHHTVASGEEGSYMVVDWRSWKLPRVCRSSLAAESQAASEACDVLLFTCLFYKLIFLPDLNLEAIESSRLSHQPVIVTDAKALYDLLIKQELQAGGASDKRTAIEVLVSQDKLSCCGGIVRWVSSELQFADGLTKSSAAQLLAQRLRCHATRIKPDYEFVASKKKTPEQRKKASEEFAIKKPKKPLQTALALTAATGVDGSPLEAGSEGWTFYVTFTVTVLAIFVGYMLFCGNLLPFKRMVTYLLKKLRKLYLGGLLQSVESIDVGVQTEPTSFSKVNEKYAEELMQRQRQESYNTYVREFYLDRCQQLQDQISNFRTLYHEASQRTEHLQAELREVQQARDRSFAEMVSREYETSRQRHRRLLAIARGVEAIESESGSDSDDS